MKTYKAVRVEEEYNAEAWWEALRERYPSLARSLERNGCAVIGAGAWDALAGLPGFGGGPEYAPNALIDCGSDGQLWADVVASPHQVFKELS